MFVRRHVRSAMPERAGDDDSMASAKVSGTLAKIYDRSWPWSSMVRMPTALGVGAACTSLDPDRACRRGGWRSARTDGHVQAILKPVPCRAAGSASQKASSSQGRQCSQQRNLRNKITPAGEPWALNPAPGGCYLWRHRGCIRPLVFNSDDAGQRPPGIIGKSAYARLSSLPKCCASR